jgi:hypothetical protein
LNSKVDEKTPEIEKTKKEIKEWLNQPLPPPDNMDRGSVSKNNMLKYKLKNRKPHIILFIHNKSRQNKNRYSEIIRKFNILLTFVKDLESFNEKDRSLYLCNNSKVL